VVMVLDSAVFSREAGLYMLGAQAKITCNIYPSK